VRAQAMAAAARAGRPHGMLSVVGVADAELEDLCRAAAAKLGGDTVCSVANLLFPTVSRAPVRPCLPGGGLAELPHARVACACCPPSAPCFPLSLPALRAPARAPNGAMHARARVSGPASRTPTHTKTRAAS
jgi:hypothetical protein